MAFRSFLSHCLFLVFVIHARDEAKAGAVDSPLCDEDFLVGQGLFDITGPPAEIPMMGYGQLEQKTAGIHMRLRSRAFVLHSLCNDKRIVVVSADLGMIFQAVKQGVLIKLRETFGDLYTDKNVLLSAIHTHSGPGGYSHHVLYDFTIKGFHEPTYRVIVDGIYKSIVDAHNHLQPAKVLLNKGELQFASMNRSPLAYQNNPAEERALYPTDTNKEMLLLKFVDRQDRPIGLINWFAVHPTNVGNDNRLITGDNKGFASYTFEKMMGNRYTSSDGFVAAFAQADEGDVSPNLWGPPNGVHDFEHAKAIGLMQFEKAKTLYEGAKIPVNGSIDYRHTYVDFSQVRVDPVWSGEDRDVTTCPAALGASFAAGSVEDGPSNFPIFKEGMVFDSSWLSRFPFRTSLQKCHKEKIVLLPTGVSPSSLWTQKQVPIQIVRVGQLAIVAMPFECTTMCGRRIRNTVKNELSSIGVTEVVIAGLANAYVGYMTTREEYSLQHYEGGSTYFGPWMLAAFQQEAARVARALRTNEKLPPVRGPEDLSRRQHSFLIGVWFDDVPPGKTFGDLIKDVENEVHPGQTVKASFWGAHLNNNLFLGGSYLKVQHLTPEGCVDLAQDWDPETTITWHRKGAAYSEIEISWTIPVQTPPGTYRLLHQGQYKDLWTQQRHPYVGISGEVNVH